MHTHVERRTFLAGATAAIAFTALYAKAAPSLPPRSGTQSLAGNWLFALDASDVGLGAAWFNKPLPSDAVIRLPGILQTQGFGEPVEADTQFVAALPRDMRWYLLPQYKAYTAPGKVKVPYLSQPVRHYLGVAWYQRDITIPDGWAGQRIALSLERTRWRTDIYIDDRLAGSNRSLVAPHDVDLGILTPGKHRLTLRIDNRMQAPAYRPDGHAVSDSLGSTWNGIVGRIELSATSPVWINDAQAYPDLASRSVSIKVAIGNATGKAGTGILRVRDLSQQVDWTAEGGQATISVALPKAEPWSEFKPTLQCLTLTLSGDNADHQHDIVFGMREIHTEGRQILLNGDVINIRATHDGGGFPLTGYPATDVETWTRIISICKQWGLNGLRFHSWCPPEAAFIAADTLGFYLQPECGMWNSFDTDGQMLAVLNDETARILKAYGNHPSFIMLGATNEPAGHYAEQLPLWDKAWRDADPRRLYTDGIGRYAPPPNGKGTPFAADYLVTPRARGPRGWFGADYESALSDMTAGSAVPCIGHEVGQWCAYPDFSIIDKFSGKAPYAAFVRGVDTGQVPYMQPGNYEIMRDTAATHGLLARNHELARASGRFQAACYKEEIEANLRTPSYSGFQLLDLHDYLGQGGALIGLLDAFWEEKGYIGSDEFRQYCNVTVPLIRLKDRVFTTAQTLTATVELAHFGEKAMASVSTRWRITDQAGRTVQSGKLPKRAAPRGKNLALGTITADLSRLRAPAAYTLSVELDGTVFHNSWRFWVYPISIDTTPPADILVTNSWAEAHAALDAGGKVLLLSGHPDKPVPDLASTTTPVFWNRLMNGSATWMLGLWCDTSHRALAGFPTDAGCDWQWIDLMPKTTAMNIEALPVELCPIVQPIDDWNRGLRLAMLFECRVGQGRLMVTSFDLSDEHLAERPGAPSLKASILTYMASEAFAPPVTLTPATAKTWLEQRYTAPVMTTTPPANTGDLVDPGQIKPRTRDTLPVHPGGK